MKPIRCLNFDLQIQRTETGFRSQVLNSPAGEASGSCGAIFRDVELENYLLKLGRPRRAHTRRIDSPEYAVAKEVGARLFSLAFGDQVKDCFRRSLDLARQQGAGLRIRLRLKEAGQLGKYPWEFLYDRNANRFIALSQATPIVRYLELAETVSPLKVNLPLRILAMISSPSDYPQLDGDREWAILQEALAPMVNDGKLLLERLENATLPSLHQRLQRAEYNILHFVGHGAFDERIDDGVLVLENREKRGRWTSGEELGVYLRDLDTLRLAVLNACEGARGSILDPFSGVAQSLVQQGLPAVVAMQFEITDEAAIIFSRGFYSAISDGYPVDAAMAQARKAIRAEDQGLEWGTPVLYVRLPTVLAPPLVAAPLLISPVPPVDVQVPGVRPPGALSPHACVAAQPAHFPTPARRHRSAAPSRR
jgi:CHAT domain